MPPPPTHAAGHGGGGFWESLFDLSFLNLVTPRIIQVLFVAGLVLYGLTAVGYLVFVLFMGRYIGGGAVLAALLGLTIGFVVALVVLRVVLELIIVMFNISADLKALRHLREQHDQEH